MDHINNSPYHNLPEQRKSIKDNTSRIVKEAQAIQSHLLELVHQRKLAPNTYTIDKQLIDTLITSLTHAANTALRTNSDEDMQKYLSAYTALSDKIINDNRQFIPAFEDADEKSA